MLCWETLSEPTQSSSAPVSGSLVLPQLPGHCTSQTGRLSTVMTFNPRSAATSTQEQPVVSYSVRVAGTISSPCHALPDAATNSFLGLIFTSVLWPTSCLATLTSWQSCQLPGACASSFHSLDTLTLSSQPHLPKILLGTVPCDGASHTSLYARIQLFS